MFDIILVQVNLSSLVSEFKSRGVLESVNHNIGAASACSSYVVYKKY